MESFATKLDRMMSAFNALGSNADG